jgi:hypothetical protein
MVEPSTCLDFVNVRSAYHDLGEGLFPDDYRQAEPECYHLVELPTGLRTRNDTFYPFCGKTWLRKDLDMMCISKEVGGYQ